MTAPAAPVAHGPAIGNARGAAARRFLADGHLPPEYLAAANPRALPPVHKRYPRAGRTPLPAVDHGLGELLRRLNGLTRMRWMSGRVPLGLSPVGRTRPGTLVAPARPVASSGARYPVEVYLAASPAAGLPAGLYHYDPAHHAVDRLREGDGRGRLTSCLAEPPDAPPAAVLLFSSVFWRNCAKYGPFGYRLQCLDTGVMVAQAVAAAWALGYVPRVHLRFDDERLDGLLGLDSEAESVLAVVTMERPEATLPAPPDEVPDWTAPAPAGLSPRQALSELPALADVVALHRACRSPLATGPRPHSEPWTRTALPTGLSRQRPGRTGVDLAAGLDGRRTAFGYLRRPLPQEPLGALLHEVTRPIRTDTAPAPGQGYGTSLACVVQQVTGVPQGSYWYDPDDSALLPTRGDGARALVLAAKSPMLADECRNSPVTLLPVGAPESGLAAFGDRWYRIQQIEAGLLAQRTALAAAALGLGSHVHCDFDVAGATAALGLDDGPLSALVLVTVGAVGPGHVEPQQSLGRW
ncbi:SagB family peptide dehydrogenase [Streptomyces sp. NPDC090021]|uniref:SagB family peptide dehydrogenase n=1 Tax=Streptomyces sp. NPDC090021 TaxID=3365919 RepID=UPI0037F9F11C